MTRYSKSAFVLLAGTISPKAQETQLESSYPWLLK